MDLFLLIVIGGITWRGANTLLATEETTGNTFYYPIWTRSPFGRFVVRFFSYGAIPLALLNGFTLYGIIGLIVCVIGTWLFMLFSNLVLRFSPTIQMCLFGLVYIIWTIRNLSQIG